jgi:hypothetical protein
VFELAGTGIAKARNLLPLSLYKPSESADIVQYVVGEDMTEFYFLFLTFVRMRVLTIKYKKSHRFK